MPETPVRPILHRAARGVSACPREEARNERSRRRSGWMRLAQDGDPIAYRALVDDLTPLLTRFLRRRVRDGADLADAYQDTFLALHRARFTYQSSRPIEPWIFAIARNVVADYGRRGYRRRVHELPTETTPDTSMEPAAEADSMLAKVLRTLPRSQREALQLLKLQGLSIREAASLIGTTPGALKLRAHRAYQALRTAFRA